MPAHAIRLILILSLSSLWFFVTPTESHACSCEDPGSPSEELERSAAVFAGRVVSVEGPDSANLLTVGFEVDMVWKGQEYATTYLTTAPHSSACGFEFVEGEQYIVYSPRGSDVDTCTRTRLLSAAQEDLNAFGDGGVPQPGTVAPTPQPGQSSTGGCNPFARPDTGVADASWLGMMIAMVWFGGRRRTRQ